MTCTERKQRQLLASAQMRSSRAFVAVVATYDDSVRVVRLVGMHGSSDREALHAEVEVDAVATLDVSLSCNVSLAKVALVQSPLAPAHDLLPRIIGSCSAGRQVGLLPLAPGRKEHR